MLLTVFLAIVFCGAITILLISAVAFVQDKRFFSSAPKEAQALIKPRNMELFYGARTMGWVMMILSALTILGVGVISIWDGFRSGFTFWQFFLRFVSIFTIYKAYDMIPLLSALLPGGCECLQRKKVRVQPEEPAAEAAGHISRGFRAGRVDLHFVLREGKDHERQTHGDQKRLQTDRRPCQLL